MALIIVPYFFLCDVVVYYRPSLPPPPPRAGPAADLHVYFFDRAAQRGVPRMSGRDPSQVVHVRQDLADASQVRGAPQGFAGGEEGVGTGEMRRFRWKRGGTREGFLVAVYARGFALGVWKSGCPSPPPPPGRGGIQCFAPSRTSCDCRAFGFPDYSFFLALELLSLALEWTLS